MMKQGQRVVSPKKSFRYGAAITPKNAARTASTGNSLEPPHYLTDYIALEEWKRVVPHLVADGTLTSARRALVAGYCTAVAKAVYAEETVLREGRYYETETSRGSVMRRRHPAAQDAAQAWSDVRKFAKQLGLSTPGFGDDENAGERRAIFK